MTTLMAPVCQPAPGANPTLPAPDDLSFEQSWPVTWPILGLVVISVLIRWTDLDLQVASLFYDRSSNSWPYEVAQPWMSIYRLGTIPSLLVGLAGLVAALFGKSVFPKLGWQDSFARRRAGWFLFLLLLLGPGLIINWGFKELWGRPRPLQCVELGGERSFVPVGNWGGTRTSNSSFPSGHAAVAFYLMAPGFIVGRHRPRLKWTWFLVGILCGLGMGLTRLAQGGHFVSDILWAGLIVYLTAVTLAQLILKN